MKLKPKTICVKLESPDGDAEFTFNRLKLNDYYRTMKGIENLKDDNVDENPLGLSNAIIAYRLEILKACTGVVGLEHEDGTPVMLHEIQSGAFTSDVVEMIVDGYLTAINEVNKVGDEKNENTAPES